MFVIQCMIDRSFPGSSVVVAWSLPKSSGKVIRKFRQCPYTLLVFNKLRESLQVLLAQQAKSLQEVGKTEIKPGQSSSNEVVLSQNAIQLFEVGFEVGVGSIEGLLKGGVLVVGAIDKLDILGMEVLVDSMSSG